MEQAALCGISQQAVRAVRDASKAGVIHLGGRSPRAHRYKKCKQLFTGGVCEVLDDVHLEHLKKVRRHFHVALHLVTRHKDTAIARAHHPTLYRRDTLGYELVIDPAGKHHTSVAQYSRLHGLRNSCTCTTVQVAPHRQRSIPCIHTSCSCT